MQPFFPNDPAQNSVCYFSELSRELLQIRFVKSQYFYHNVLPIELQRRQPVLQEENRAETPFFKNTSQTKCGNFRRVRLKKDSPLTTAQRPRIQKEAALRQLLSFCVFQRPN